MTKLKLNWTKKIIKNYDDIVNLNTIFLKQKPDYSSIDTETNGLHIILSKPFVVSFGWYNNTTKEAFAASFDLTIDKKLTRFFFKTLYRLTGKTIKCLFWNAKFDIHMLYNYGQPYPHNHISDVQGYVRLAHEAIPKNEGGVNLALKTYATKYIDPNAKHYLNKIAQAQTSLRRERTKAIREKGFKIGKINEFLKDKLNEPSGLPEEIQEIYKELPDPNNYENLPRELILKYAVYDIIYTLEAFNQCLPIVKHRNQMNIIKEEEELISVLFEMERCGFKLDIKYILSTKEKLKAHILKQRKNLEKLFGEPIKVGQHKRIKQLFGRKYQLALPNCDKKTLTELEKHPNKEVSQIAKIINELRTLEKWYSTYIIKWIQDIDKTDRVYTSINQFNTVSGRVSSDFQQFPREGYLDEDGNELFNPRRMFKVSGNGYNKIAYLDYSQIELRIQAMYTILVMGGDLNMCRAYMPYKCHTKNGVYFDYNNPEHLSTYKEYKWFLNENNTQEWHPTDLHSTTTKAAFPEINPESEEFSNHYRKIGKATNFACNYGANINTLMYQFDHSRDIATRLYNAYYNSFPGVKDFADYVESYLRSKPYIPNLFGRRYYDATAHKCRNYLIQGSAADFLKQKMIAVHKFLKENNLRTKFQMNIHDELSFEIYDGEEYIIPEIKKIMENLPGTKVPIVADVEITNTCWAETREFTNEDIIY